MKCFLSIVALTVVTTIAAVSSTFAQPSDRQAEKRPKFSIPNDSTIVEFAIDVSSLDGVDDNPEDFDILIAALQTTGVIDIFDGMSTYTVFAPHDGAFIALAEALTNQELSEANAAGAILGLGSDYVAQVLAYHVTKGARNSRSVTGAKQVSTLLKGESISVDNGFVVANESDAALIDKDNRFADGMIHVIDYVLVPFLPGTGD